MKQSRAIPVLALLAALTLLPAGCRKPFTPEPEPATGEDLQQFHTELRELLQAGETNAVIDFLAARLSDPAWAGFRPGLFRDMLIMLIQAGNVEEAEQRLLANLPNEELAQAGLGIVRSHYRRTKGAKSSQWTEDLLGADLPPSLRPTVLVWYGEDLFADGRFQHVLDTWLPMVRDGTDAKTVPKVLEAMLRSLLRSAALDQVDMLTQCIEEVLPATPVLRSLIAVTRTESLRARKDWEKLDRHIRQAADSLADGDFERCLRIASRSGAKEDPARLDRLYAFVIEKQDSKTNSVVFASRQWVQSAVARKDDGALLDRLDTALGKGVKSKHLLYALRNGAYHVLQSGNAKNKERLLAIAERMDSALEADREKAHIRMLLLDAAFMDEDYQRAVDLVEARIPDKDDAWHNMALGKLRAHLALKNGNTNDAVRHFREFMKHVETWEQTEKDPATGVQHTKEMTLGLNAKRIGDLLTAAGDKEGARKAYAEARGYYAAALKEANPESPELELIQKEMAGIPAETP